GLRALNTLDQRLFQRSLLLQRSYAGQFGYGTFQNGGYIRRWSEGLWLKLRKPQRELTVEPSADFHLIHYLLWLTGIGGYFARECRSQKNRLNECIVDGVGADRCVLRLRVVRRGNDVPVA